jgi:amino acid adenylation domain-containing protein
MQIHVPIDLRIKEYLTETFTDTPVSEKIIVAFFVYLFRKGNHTRIDLGLHADFSEETQRDSHYLLAKVLPYSVEIDPASTFETTVTTLLDELHTITGNQLQDLVVDLPQLPAYVNNFVQGGQVIAIKKVQQPDQAAIDSNNRINFIVTDECCAFVFDPQLWREHDIQKMAHEFHSLLHNICTDPYKPVHAISLLTQQEYNQQVYAWNDTSVPYPKDKLVQQLVEAQVEKTPDAIALVCEQVTLTYGQLNQRANQLARYLQKNGVGPEVMVGICLERSIDMVVGLLAILKAGGAYVPLDRSYPRERIQLMLEETQVPYIITIGKWKESLPVEQGKLILLDGHKPEIDQQATENIIPGTNAQNLACVIFTSGSTGKPKGVCIIHRGIVRLVKQTNYAVFNEHSVILGMAPVAFDVSLCEIWGSLINGGTLILVPLKHPSLIELKQLILAHQVNTCFMTVALFHLLVEEGMEDLSCLKQLLTGGDILSLSHARRALEQIPDLRLVNSYGPTENTCYSSFFPVTKENLIHPTVPIGRPNSNSHVYILDKRMQPVPIGSPGELVVGGDGLARGYLNREELTKEKFIKSPFHPPLSPYLYKTGDLARYLPDGNIEFIGRLDDQVKIRGYRVELGEIEAILKEHDQISEAVVIADGTTAGDKKLIAYVLIKPESNFHIKKIIGYLKSKLPEYMIPAFIQQVNSFALTPHGKIDKKNLPPLTQPDRREPSIHEHSATTPSSSDILYDQLKQIWKQILNIESIRIDDHFFEMGGDSLMAVKLVSAIYAQLGYNFPVVTIFAKPTIRTLAQFIRHELNNESWNSLVAVQPEGNKQPIFCIHPVTGEVDYVYKLAAYFDNDQPIYGLQAVGLNGQDAPLETIEEMAAHYIKLIVAKYPEGPYHLAGYSVGGVIAYEMAVQLKKEGKEVGLLALFDTYAHKPGHNTYLHMPVKDVMRSYSNYLLDVSIPVTNKWKALRREVPFFLGHLLKKFERHSKQPIHDSQEGVIVETFRKVKQATIKANDVYVIRPCDVHILFFRMVDGPVKYVKEYDYGWRKYAESGVGLINLPGEHTSIFKAPSMIQIIAEAIKEYLQHYNEQMQESEKIAVY